MAERVIINIFYLANASIWGSVAGLWYVLTLYNPYTSRVEVTGLSVLLFSIALMAIFFCYIRKPKMLVGSAVVSLLPIGLYMLATPGLFALIGVLNLAALVSGLLVLVSDKKENVQSDS